MLYIPALSKYSSLVVDSLIFEKKVIKYMRPV